MLTENFSEIWRYGTGYVVHCSELDDARDLLKLRGTHLHSEYYYPGGKREKDVWIPGDLKGRAMKQLKLSRVSS